MADDLRLDHSWSIGESAFALLVEDLRTLRPDRIVEFGSGTSSVRLALALPQTHILTIDNSAEYYARTRSLAEKYGIGDRLHVELRPLTWQWHAYALYQSYRPDPFRGAIDAVIIDGPPSWTRRGREACLHMVAGQLRVGGRVYLDDCRRAGEKQTLHNWQHSYPNAFSTRLVAVDHHLAILEKLRDTRRPRLAASVIADSGLQNIRRTARKLRDRLRGRREPNAADGEEHSAGT